MADSNGKYINPNEYFDLIKNNTYYLWIKGDSDIFNYTFSIKGPFEDDFGNSLSMAKAIDLGKTIDGIINYYSDIDVFTFNTVEEGYYSISVSSILDNMLEKISLYNKNGNLIKDSIKIDREENHYNLQANETYFIVLNPRVSYVEYNIKADGPYIDDYVKSGSNSKKIVIDDPVNGCIDYPKDVDMFRFIPSTSGKYYFELDSDFNFSMSILNRSFNNMKYKEIKKNILMVELSSNNDCYIKIDGIGTQEIGSYQLLVTDKFENLLPLSFTISGYVKPEFYNINTNISRAGFIVSLKGTNLFAVTDENGYFQIADVPVSDESHSIEISKDGYLSRTVSNITANNDIIITRLIEVWAGDISSPRDEIINISDVLVLAKDFNTCIGDLDFIESADINGDSVINILDAYLIAKHFNQTSTDYPPIY